VLSVGGLVKPHVLTEKDDLQKSHSELESKKLANPETTSPIEHNEIPPRHKLHSGEIPSQDSSTNSNDVVPELSSYEQVENTPVINKFFKSVLGTPHGDPYPRLRHPKGKHGEHLTQYEHYSDTTCKVMNGRVIVRKYQSEIPFYKTLGRKIIRSKNAVRRSDSVVRARASIYDILHCNYPVKKSRYSWPVEMTGTYAETAGHTVEYRNEVLKDFTAFIRLLRERYGENIGYLGVMELQKERGKSEGHSGVWHFHLIVFNLGYNDMQVVKSFWPHGDLRISRQKHGKATTEELSMRYTSYVAKGAKYLAKELGEYLQSGEKTYLCSKGLLRPDTYNRVDDVKRIIDEILFNPELAYCVVGHGTGQHYYYKTEYRQWVFDIPINSS
jgi:hypothetical protein